MSIRDLLVAAFVIGSLPSCFRRPFIGVLVFSVLGYMRIQDLAWGFARFERWSFYVAVTTLAGYMVDRNKQPIVIEMRTVMMIALAAVIGIGHFFAVGNFPVVWGNFIEFCKIVGVAIFTTAVVRTRDQLRALIWVIAMSFGFYGVKSGIQGILSGGSMTIDRGPGGMLFDNNNFALAMVLVIPILVHLAASEKNPLFQKILRAMVPLTMITVVLTRSRGAALSMALAVMLMVWRSRNMVLGLAFMGLAGLALLTFAPESYLERLQTIRDYKSDGSAMGRLAAWKVAGNMIRAHPVFGVGLDRFRDNYAAHDYDRPPGVPVERKSTRVAHNSYLQIWAECGTIAFGLYMTMLLLTMIDLWRVRRAARRRYHASWILSYATMFETSMVAFLCGSVFLNRAQFDLIYHYIAIVLVFGRLARAEMADEQRYPMRVTGRRFGPLAAIEGRGFARRVRLLPAFRETHLLGPERS